MCRTSYWPIDLVIDLLSWLLTYFCLSDYRDNDVDDEESGLELYFQTDFEILGKVEQHELKPDGANVKVTNANKKEYIE